MADARPRPGRPGRHRTRRRPLSALQRVPAHAGGALRLLPRPLIVAALTGGLLSTSAAVGGAMNGTDDVDVSAPASAVAPTTTAAEQRDVGSVSRDADRVPLAERATDVPASREAIRAQRREAIRTQRRERAARVRRQAVAASKADPRAIARDMLPAYGWSESEFDCLDALWIGESDWEWNADNPTSSAYGIPQALPGKKMASAGSDWKTNPATQIEWGLGYIRDSYGTPCAANEFKLANNWY